MLIKLSRVWIIWVALLLGCSDTKKTPVMQGIEQNILYYANGDEPKSLDPHLAGGYPDYNILMNVFEGLVSKDPKTLMPVPGVAERWTVSDDGRVYRFFLRKNALWSNGDRVTAYDFKNTWARALNPAMPNMYAQLMYIIAGAEAFHKGQTQDFSTVGVVAINNDELEVTLKYPSSTFLQLLDFYTFYPMHLKSVQAINGLLDVTGGWVTPQTLISNGAFKLTEWKVNQHVQLQKSSTYWDADHVKLQGVYFLPIEDQQAEERAFRAGQIHLTNTPQMAVEKIQYYQDHHPEILRIFPTYAVYYYGFNTLKPPFNDVRVRKAFALAIDRSLLVAQVTKGGERPAFNFLPPYEAGFVPPVLWQEDKTLAQTLLAEAGYPQGKGFPPVTLLFNTHDGHQKLATAIQQMLKQALNVEVVLDNKEWKVYMLAKQNKQHDFFRGGWVADYLDPISFLDVLTSSSGNNSTGWQNADYDALIDRLKTAMNEKEKSALLQQANQLLAEQMPVMPIYYYSDINLVHTSVQGWHNNQMHYHPLKNVYLVPPSTITHTESKRPRLLGSTDM